MSKDTLKLVAVNFNQLVFVGSRSFSKVAEGEVYIKPGSSIHLELNEKTSSVRITVEGNGYDKLTVVPVSNVSCFVYSEVADVLIK